MLCSSNELGNLLNRALVAAFDGRLPARQSLRTALGAMLTHDLASALSSHSRLYARPVSEVTTTFLERHGISFEPMELGVDFAAVDGGRLILGCESEMHAWHYIGSAIEPRFGHTYDFARLLVFPAPYLLYVACVSTEYLGLLAGHLKNAAERFSSRWSSKHLGIILLPSATRQIQQVLIGIGTKGGEVQYHPLG